MDLPTASKILNDHAQIEAAKEAEQRILSYRTWYRPDLICYTAPQPTVTAVSHTDSATNNSEPSTAPPHAQKASPYLVEEEGLEPDEKLRRKVLRVAERLRPTVLLRLAVTEANYEEAVRAVSADLDDIQKQYSREAARDYYGGGGVAPYARMIELQKTVNVLIADMKVLRSVADAAKMVIAGDPASRSKTAAALHAFDDSAMKEKGVYSGRMVPQEMRFKTKAQMEELFQAYLREACGKHVEQDTDTAK